MNLGQKDKLNGKTSPAVIAELAPTDESRVYSNVIPLRRDRHGNPIPRRHLFLRPLVSLDPQSLQETAEAFMRSPEAGARTLPWLKAKNAIAADANVGATREGLYRKIDKDNRRLQAQIERMEPKLQELAETARDARVAAVLGLQGLPISFRPDDPSLALAANEPVTLEELAGQTNLPPPEMAPGWWNKIGYKVLAAIGGGTIFGISFGLLTERIELADLAQEWPLILVFAAIGVTIMTIVGGVFPFLGRRLGSWLYCRAIETPWISAASFIAVATLTVGLIYTIIRIEAKVEQLGIFKGLTANSSMKAVDISSTEVMWVSLMLVVPVVFCYLLLGVEEGERTSNLAYLKGLLARRREEVRSSLHFSRAAALHQEMRDAIIERRRVEADIQQLMGGIRWDLTLGECERLEDMEMDATAHSWATEDLMLEVARVRGDFKLRPRAERRPVRGVRRWLSGWFG